MKAPALTPISDVIEAYTGRSRAVLQYCLRMKALVDEAKRPGFSRSRWSMLADTVAVEEFERIGAFKEVMNWDDYLDFLMQWAPSSEWDCLLKRITESGERAFLELEEHTTSGSHRSIVNSLSVYAFTPAGKLRHLSVFLQMAPPPALLVPVP